MKGGLIFLMLLLTSYGPKPKFRYFDLSAPIYINVNSLPKDVDDEVSKFLKDTLVKVKANLISYSQFDELLKKYFEDLRNNIKNFSEQQRSGSSSFVNTAFASRTRSQSFSIRYTSLTDQKATLESCDSIGFSFVAVPFNSDQKPVRKMWHIKEIATRSKDSIALFLLKQM